MPQPRRRFAVSSCFAGSLQWLHKRDNYLARAHGEFGLLHHRLHQYLLRLCDDDSFHC